MWEREQAKEERGSVFGDSELAQRKKRKLRPPATYRTSAPTPAQARTAARSKAHRPRTKVQRSQLSTNLPTYRPEQTHTRRERHLTLDLAIPPRGRFREILFYYTFPLSSRASGSTMFIYHVAKGEWRPERRGGHSCQPQVSLDAGHAQPCRYLPPFLPTLPPR